jgi:T-complex protein 1 subunit zeta
MTFKTLVRCAGSLVTAFTNDRIVAALQDEHAEGNIVGLNLATGEAMDPVQEGVYDSFRVLRNCIASATGIASNLLLCDEMLKARQMGRQPEPGEGQ